MITKRQAPEHRPPAEIREKVVRPSLLQGVVVRQRVVHPPVDSRLYLHIRQGLPSPSTQLSMGIAVFQLTIYI